MHEEFVGFPLPSPRRHLLGKAKREENKAMEVLCLESWGQRSHRVSPGQHGILDGRDLSPEPLFLDEASSHCALPRSEVADKGHGTWKPSP